MRIPAQALARVPAFPAQALARIPLDVQAMMPDAVRRRFGLGDYPFPNTPIRLLDGREIQDPAGTRPEPGDCIPYQCGADAGNQGARMWCSYYGQVGSRVCLDPACAPWRDQIPGCTLPYPATQPPPILTPQNIVQPLPDIGAMLSPVPVPDPERSLWCDLNAAIAQHPFIALGVLVAGAALVWRRK